MCGAHFSTGERVFEITYNSLVSETEKISHLIMVNDSVEILHLRYVTMISTVYLCVYGDVMQNSTLS